MPTVLKTWIVCTHSTSPNCSFLLILLKYHSCAHPWTENTSFSTFCSTRKAGLQNAKHWLSFTRAALVQTHLEEQFSHVSEYKRGPEWLMQESGRRWSSRNTNTGRQFAFFCQCFSFIYMTQVKLIGLKCKWREKWSLFLHSCAHLKL